MIKFILFALLSLLAGYAFGDYFQPIQTEQTTASTVLHRPQNSTALMEKIVLIEEKNNKLIFELYIRRNERAGFAMPLLYRDDFSASYNPVPLPNGAFRVSLKFTGKANQRVKTKLLQVLINPRNETQYQVTFPFNKVWGE